MAVKTQIKELLKAIGFSLEDGKLNFWKKIYSSHSNYKIGVDIENESIDFGDSITLGDKTTSNFEAYENHCSENVFVVAVDHVRYIKSVNTKQAELKF
jgi:hypothetical protein